MENLTISFSDLSSNAQELVSSDFTTLVSYENLTELPNGDLKDHKILHLITDKPKLNTFVIDKYNDLTVETDNIQSIIKDIISDNLISQLFQAHTIQFIAKHVSMKDGHQIARITTNQWVNLKLKILKDNEIDQTVNGTIVVPYYSCIQSENKGIVQFVISQGEAESKISFKQGGIYKFDYKNITYLEDNKKFYVNNNLNDITFVVSDNISVVSTVQE